MMKRTSGNPASELRLPHLAENAFPVRLAFRNDLHLARKAWHMFMGVMMAFIYMSGMSASTAVICLASAFGLSVLVETARLRMPVFNEKIVRLWGPIMRSCEVNRVSGMPYYVLATLLSIAIFPKPVAVLAVLYLACGDPMASLFGILYGNKSYRFANGKSLIGTLAGVVTCALVTYFFLRNQTLPEYALVGITLIGGIAGGTAELMPFDTDDNFTIPIVSGFALWLTFILFGI